MEKEHKNDLLSPLNFVFSTQIQMPSGSKILVTYFERYASMNIYVYTSPILRTEGLCGSFDGNPDNDVRHRFTGRIARTGTGPHNVIDDDVANSWR